MSTRTRSMAIDGHSFEAGTALTLATLSRVQLVIVACLTDGPAVDDELIARYDRRIAADDAPRVTPQRIRTARKALADRGIVRATNIEGRSANNHRSTVWALAASEKTPTPLW